jgi:hypothetical protein
MAMRIAHKSRRVTGQASYIKQAMRGLVRLVLSVVLFAAPSLAQDAPPQAPAPARAAPEDPTLRPLVAERRNGIVLGIAPGLAAAGSSGYPNNQRLVGNPDFYSESPLLFGQSTTIFVMGALTDYVNFGPMVNIASMSNDKWKSRGFGVGFRVEVFPLIRLVPALADTAVYGMGGVGATELQAQGPYPSADGTQSFAGIGLHHEFRLFRFLGGHFAGGPYVEYDAIFTTTNERHWGTVGFRFAWYGGGVVLDKH